MSGAGIEVDVASDPRIAPRLARLAQIDLRPLLAGIAMEVETQTRRRIQSEKAGPDGSPWPAWSRRYAKTRHSGNSLLQGVGHLLGSITSEVVDDGVLVGSPLKYAAIHQFGGTINMPARKQDIYFKQDRRTGEVGTKFVRKSKSNFAQTVDVGPYSITMPARPFLGLSDTNREDVIGMVEDYLEDMANG